MDEHRCFQRWKISKEAQVKIGDSADYIHCVVSDLSFKGIQLVLKQHLTLDKFLKMNIMFFRELSFDFEAWTVWHRKIGAYDSYGLYFSKIKDSDKEKIYQFVKRYLSNELSKQCWQGLNDEEKGGSMMQNSFDDKRIFARFGVNYALKFLDLNNNKEGVAQTQDVSAKGIGIETTEALSPRTALEMWLQVPDKGQPFYTRGEVIWSKMIGPNKYRSGVELERADLMGMSRVFRSM